MADAYNPDDLISEAEDLYQAFEVYQSLRDEEITVEEAVDALEGLSDYDIYDELPEDVSRNSFAPILGNDIGTHTRQLVWIYEKWNNSSEGEQLETSQVEEIIDGVLDKVKSEEVVKEYLEENADHRADLVL